MSYQQLSAAVRRRRRELGLSEVALADRAGIARLTVRRIEAGEPVRAASLAGLEDALQWRSGRADKLLGSDRPRSPRTPIPGDLSDRELVRLLQQVSREVARRLDRRAART